jgi:hypothetical protein
MRRVCLLVFASALAAPVSASDPLDLIDPKTHEYTPRGVIASIIAGAEVMEIRCGYKDQITAALGKANRLGMPLDLNRKEDYSDVVYFATEIIQRIDRKEGFAAWCKDKAPNMAKFLKE